MTEEALVKSREKWTEVRSKSVDQTGRGILVRWTWVWFARTKNFKEGGKATPFCEVWGGARFLGESGPANPQDSPRFEQPCSCHCCCHPDGCGGGGEGGLGIDMRPAQGVPLSAKHCLSFFIQSHKHV